MIRFPKNLQLTRQSDVDALLEKRWRAGVWMHTNPIAKAMNLKVRRYFRNRLELAAVVQLNRRNP